MDSIGIVYKGDAIRKHIWLKRDVTDTSSGTTGYRFCEGIVTRCEEYLPEDDPEARLEYKHYVLFGNGDGSYYDLTDMEMTGYLLWKQPQDETFIKFDNSAGTGAASPSRARTASMARPVVTPVRTAQQERSRTNMGNGTSRRVAHISSGNPINSKRQKVTIKPDPDQHADISSNLIQKEGFGHWLEKIHKGARGNGISEANVRSVLNRFDDLVTRKGITYKRWDEGIKFHEGETIDLTTDFETLLQKAKDFEEKHGTDKGNGWLLRHPIKKLHLYKQYILQKRNERANPIDCTGH
mmetsp:Transcript_22133/g.51020  ORF Transcript_22133/g.51020 Transcript_22133/m.51020 type:complete len:296 (+) Transcript_22133:85-972(+)